MIDVIFVRVNVRIPPTGYHNAQGQGGECMRPLVDKTLLLLFAMTLAVPDNVVALVGVLLVISCSCLTEWLLYRTDTYRCVAWIPAIVIVAACVPLVSWCVLLPVVVYDMPRLPDQRSIAPLWLWFARFVWVLPLIWHIATMPDRTMIVITVATIISFAWGLSSHAAAQLRRELQRMQDRARALARTSRRSRAEFEEERAQSVRMATLNERTRIAREIHDNVGHLLTRAIMQAQAGKAVADATGDETAAHGFAALADTASVAMTMVRRSVHDLADDGTDFAAQIEDAVRSVGGASPDFAVTLSNEVSDAPATVARCFSMVIRESLSNVIRHSEATSARVTIREFPALWQLVVQDPGPSRHDDRQPVDDDDAMRGMGLADIDSRVRALAGMASCGPYDGGWRVFVTVPKHRHNAALNGGNNG